MKLRLILVGIAASFLLPLAGADARAVVNPGLDQVAEGTNLERGYAQTAENFWREEREDDGKGDKDGKHHKCHRHDKGDRDKGDRDKGDDHEDCDKSPSKPD